MRFSYFPIPDHVSPEADYTTILAHWDCSAVQIINSLAANRPASEAAALAAGIRPPPPPSLLNGTSSTLPQPIPSYFSNQPESSSDLTRGGAVSSMVLDDDEPLPPSAQPPTPGFGSRTTNVKVQSFMSAGAALGGGDGGNGLSESNWGKEHGTLVAHRTVFFFKLEREIEKVRTSLHAVRFPPARGLTSKLFF